MSEVTGQAGLAARPSGRRRAERCPDCGGELDLAGSITGRRGILYLIARCLRCQTAFWRAPGAGGAWE